MSSRTSRNQSIPENVAVIIPVAPAETTWRRLLIDLGPLPPGAEVILVGTKEPPRDWRNVVENAGLRCMVRWLQTMPGRARQLNHGAANTSRAFLWFLHADSRITSEGIEALRRALSRSAQSLYFFELSFELDGPAPVWINARGANFRSRYLLLPFGDQGFCLSAAQFIRMGGFDERTHFGEDHLFVWKAHRLGIAVRSVGATISTSARKYARHGWFQTTLTHLLLTAKQAAPQLLGFLFRRVALCDRDMSRARSRLIIFTRCPDPGRCKTRLISNLGVAGATALHESLVGHTFAWAIDLIEGGEIDVEVQFTGDNLDRLKSLSGGRGTRLRFRQQSSGDLGERIAEACDIAFNEGCSRVVVVGTDCPALDGGIVSAAMEQLERNDLVIGPAADGGYYLIAMSRRSPELFQDISWGTPAVLRETLHRADDTNITVCQLQILDDVDRPADLECVRKYLHENSVGR